MTKSYPHLTISRSTGVHTAMGDANIIQLFVLVVVLYYFRPLWDACVFLRAPLSADDKRPVSGRQHLARRWTDTIIYTDWIIDALHALVPTNKQLERNKIVVNILSTVFKTRRLVSIMYSPPTEALLFRAPNQDGESRESNITQWGRQTYFKFITIFK